MKACKRRYAIGKEGPSIKTTKRKVKEKVEKVHINKSVAKKDTAKRA
jgi:hypothetical protein